MKEIYAQILLPLKLSEHYHYLVPENFIEIIKIGVVVDVNLNGRSYSGIVLSMSDSKPDYQGKIKPLLGINQDFFISEPELNFWKWISDYYLSTLGEVYKSAIGDLFFKSKKLKNRAKREKKTQEISQFPDLDSAEEYPIFIQVLEKLSSNKPLLINTLPGENLTLLNLIIVKNYIDNGKSVLLLSPTIALSKENYEYFSKLFGNQVLAYDSSKSVKERASIRDRVSKGGEALLIVGVRNSIFLPYTNLGLIVLEKESDIAYKQNDAAPRINTRDSAVKLSRLHNASIILSDDSPSLESIYNVINKKYNSLTFSRISDNKNIKTLKNNIQIVNILLEKNKGRFSNFFANKTLDTIYTNLKEGKQTLIINLNNYPNVQQEVFEFVRTSFIDSKTLVNSSNSQLKEFYKGDCDILISPLKSFSKFSAKRIGLIVFLEFDSIYRISDFRSDERALQTFRHFLGIKDKNGDSPQFLIQTTDVNNSVIRGIRRSDYFIDEILREREEFAMPPFSRMIDVYIESRYQKSTEIATTNIHKQLKSIENSIISEPQIAVLDEKASLFKQKIQIKLLQNNHLSQRKRTISSIIQRFSENYANCKFIMNVDPY